MKAVRLRASVANVSVATSGTFSAPSSSVQVQLTEYATDSFPLSIELKSLVLMNPGDTTPKKSFLREVRPSGPLSRDGLGAGRTSFSGKRKAPRFQTAPGGVIGATCLSIIGMIEPGRTVRLYRQIH